MGKILALVFFLSGMPAAFASDGAQPADQVYKVNGTLDDQSAKVAARTSWQFLGCVESSHDCADEASNHGYHHYSARPDHHRCDHHHLACFAR